MVPLRSHGLSGDELAGWDEEEELAQIVADLLGVGLNKRFRCPFAIPGDEHFAQIRRDKDRGYWIWFDDRCWPKPVADWRDPPEGKKRKIIDRRKSFTLAEVYAAIVSHQLVALPASSHARWKLRLLIDHGLVPRPHIDLPPLPADAEKGLRDAYACLQLLFDVRASTDKPGEEVAISQRFLAAWCGGQSREWGAAAIEAFTAAGVITLHHVEQLTRLYVPGKQAHDDDRQEGADDDIPTLI